MTELPADPLTFDRNCRIVVRHQNSGKVFDLGLRVSALEAEWFGEHSLQEEFEMLILPPEGPAPAGHYWSPVHFCWCGQDDGQKSSGANVGTFEG